MSTRGPTMKLVFRRESTTSWKVALALNYGLSWTEALAEINKKLPACFIKYRPIQRFSYDDAVGQTTIVNDVSSYEFLIAHSRRHGSTRRCRGGTVGLAGGGRVGGQAATEANEGVRRLGPLLPGHGW